MPKANQAAPIEQAACTTEQARAQDARKHFDAAAERHRATGGYDAAARVELLREYMTNPEFRLQLEQHTWQMLNH